jgi:hypothetical protein
VFGKWLQKRNDRLARKMIELTVARITTRDLSSYDGAAFCGHAAAELAKKVATGSIGKISEPNDRLLSALFAVVYANHFSQLSGADSHESTYFAARETLGEFYFHDHETLASAYSKLLIGHIEALDVIQSGCVRWLKSPTPTVLAEISETFRFMHAGLANPWKDDRITDKPQFPF